MNLNIRLASKSEAGRLIVTDSFNSFFPWLTIRDMEIRMLQPMKHLPLATAKQQYFAFIKNEASAFSKEEANRLSVCIKEINKLVHLRGLAFNPKEIILVKTTGREEGHAGYTRDNCIFIPQRKFEKPGNLLLSFLTHEMFHLFSRYNPEKRFQLYALIGFAANENISIPENMGLMRVTNPDAADFRFVIKIPDGDGLIKEFVPFIRSKPGKISPNKTMFDYIDFAYFGLRDNKLQTGRYQRIDRINGWYKIKTEERPADIVSHPLYYQIGLLTGYIIHPEEIMADYFSFWLLSAGDQNLIKGIDRVSKLLLKKLDSALVNP